MAVAYKNAGTFTSVAGGTLNNVPLPPSLNDGDVVIVLGKDRGAASLAIDTGSANADWTLIDEQLSGSGGVVGVVAYWARKSGGVDPSLPDFAGGSNHIYAQTYAFSGCTTSGSPIDAVGAAALAGSAASSVSGSSFNTNTAGTMLVCAGGAGNATTAYSAADWADADVTGETIQEQNFSTDGTDGSIALVTAQLGGAAGATGAFTMTKTGAGDQHAFLLFALKAGATPATGGASGSGAASATGRIVAASSGSAGGAGSSLVRSPTSIGVGAAAGIGAASGSGFAIAAASGTASAAGDASAIQPVDLAPTTGHIVRRGYTPGISQELPNSGNTSPPALFVNSGVTGTSHTALSPRFGGFTPGQPFYLSYQYKVDRISGTTNATLKSKIRWWGAAGPLTTTEHSVTLNNDVNEYTFVEARHIAPAGAVEGAVEFEIVTPSPTQHKVWIIEPRCAVTERGAEIVSWINGPSAAAVGYDYLGQTINANVTLTYNLVNSSGTLQGGTQSASYAVLSGTVNGKNAASGNTSLTVVNGTVDFTITSITSPTAVVQIAWTYNGVQRIIQTTITRVLADPPASPGTGGGGGGTGNYPASQTSGWPVLTSTSYTNLITDRLQIAMPTGKTTANIVVNLAPLWLPKGGQNDWGPWNIDFKLQRNTGTTASPTWTDIGSVQASSPDPFIWDYEDLSGSHLESVDGTMYYNFNDTGRTAGVTYEYRVVAKLSATVTGNTGGMNFSGNMTLSAP